MKLSLKLKDIPRLGTRVVCPLHGWTVELADGCAMAPDKGCAKRFAVEVDAQGGIELKGPHA